jgi:hypothetical protein
MLEDIITINCVHQRRVWDLSMNPYEQHAKSATIMLCHTFAFGSGRSRVFQAITALFSGSLVVGHR